MFKRIKGNQSVNFYELDSKDDVMLVLCDCYILERRKKIDIGEEFKDCFNCDGREIKDETIVDKKDEWEQIIIFTLN